MRVASALGDDGLLRCGLDLLRRCVGREPEDFGFDLLSGKAGAILALVAVSRLLHDQGLLDIAIRFGDKLLRTAERSGGACSWQPRRISKHPNLTGFSHGTAGVACALLDLFSATGDTRYRVAAEQAFCYEHGWFDAATGNWPDLREYHGRGRRRALPLAFATTWYHGAPGIALSRLRAYELLGDEVYKREATIALRSTRLATTGWLSSPTRDHSLCHGLAGNADVLLQGWQMLGHDRAEDLAVAVEVAESLIARNGPLDLAPSYGVPVENPGLMLGAAGIGYFFLRPHSQATPSVLMLGPRYLS